MTDYRSHDVPIGGGASYEGTLHVGEWGPADPSAPTVLLIHGITGNHRNWTNVAERLPAGVRAVAVDLRGRGRSAALPGPYGMSRHAADLAAALDHLKVRRALVVGHSMGAFVGVVFGHQHRKRVSGRVLVDGGLPVKPGGLLGRTDVATFLGPAMDRLSQDFESREEYRDFWREHPSLGPYWSDGLERSLGLDQDLMGAAPALRSSVNPEAVHADVRSMVRGMGLRRALFALGFVGNEVTFVRAERGMHDEPKPLYSNRLLQVHGMFVPRLRPVTFPDSNHYTVVLGDRGADQLASLIERRLERAASTRIVRAPEPVNRPSLEPGRRAQR